MSRDLMPLLADASVRAALLTALVWTVLTICRVRDARVQHASWTIVVVGMMTMPMLSALLPPVGVPLRGAVAEWAPIEMSDAVARVETQASTAPEPSSRPPVVEQRSVAPRATVSPARLHKSQSQSTATPRSARWSVFLTGLYLGVAALMMLRTVIGWRRASQLVRASRPVSVPIAADRRLRSIAESPHVAVPVTIGVLRPTIVLPTSWRSWPEAKVRAVLAHEGAHVDRRDPLVAFVARLNVCLFWFHPLAWWLERTLARTAELVCDEAGAQGVGERGQYAAIVTEIAGDASRHGGRMSWVASGLGGGHLVARLDRLTRAPVPHASGFAKLAAAGICVGLVAIVAACRLDGPLSSISDERAAELQWHYSDETAVREEDRADYEAMLLKSKAENPDGPWSARLGRFYAATMIGLNVQIRTSESRARTQEITGAHWNSSSAKRAREILAATTDGEMLAAAGEYLWSGATIRPMRAYSLSFEAMQALDKEREALLLSYLERAVALDPELVSARAALFAVRERSRRSRFYWEWRDVPVSSQYEFIAALDERERFERLPYAARAAWDSLQSNLDLSQFRNDRNLDEFRRIREEQVGKYLEDLLALAPRFVDHLDYGTAMFKAHMLFASLAMHRGDARSAVEHVRIASQASSSEGLTYGRYVAYWRVLNQLIDAGEGEAVASYLERMAEKSAVSREDLRKEVESVRGGATGLIFGPGYY